MLNTNTITPLHIFDAQSNGSNPPFGISAPERGILNEKLCNKKITIIDLMDTDDLIETTDLMDTDDLIETTDLMDTDDLIETTDLMDTCAYDTRIDFESVHDDIIRACYHRPQCNAYSGEEGYRDEFETRCNLCADISCQNCNFELNNLTVFQSTENETLSPSMTRCRCDDSEQEPYITCYNCGFYEYEYYTYRYKSSIYCNECALDVCGKLIEKPKYAFSRSPVKKEKNDFAYCDYLMLDEEKNKCNCDILCSSCYNAEQKLNIRKYAEEYNITIEEAIDYQTHCHCCGKQVEDGMFDESNHQYCGSRCFETCEDYWYECFRGEECKVCGIWEYRTRRDSLTAHDIELSDCEPVLNAIYCFKELGVYGQLYECIEDLVDYFDSDRHWRHDFN